VHERVIVPVLEIAVMVALVFVSHSSDENYPMVVVLTVEFSCCTLPAQPSQQY
jgi:hypothetical protein